MEEQGFMKDEQGRPTSPMLELAKKDETNKEVKKIMEKSGLEGIFKDFDPKVQDAIADSMRNILTQELKGLTPEEQIKKLKKMYTPTMKGGRKRRRKRTRKRRKSRRKSRRKLRRKSRRRKT